METHTTDNYSTDRITLLTTLEADIPRAYVDSVGIATFGVGLNLQDHGELLLQALGFDFTGELLAQDGEALRREREFGRRLIEEVFEANYPVGSYSANIADNNPAKVAIDTLLQERRNYFQGLAYDPANFASEDDYNDFVQSLAAEFEITNDNAREELLTKVLDGYTVPDVNGNSKVSGGYEALLDEWLDESGVGDAQPALWFQDSKERMALLSLAFNSRTYGADLDSTSWNDKGLPRLLGPSLATALLEDNRAEAWYEIRYNSNGGTSASDGIAKRRYAESTLFGLYDDPQNVTLDGALDVYHMYTEHKSWILNYENTYGHVIENARVAELGLSTPTLEEAFWAASSELLLEYGEDDIVIDYRDIQVADETGSFLEGSRRDGWTLSDTAPKVNDLLIGRDGNDSLEGGGGDDILIGGGGVDFLYGGEGNDVLRGGDDDDVLEGGAGDDKLYGGQGNDILDGGSGENWLYGGEGNDTYTLNGDGSSINHIIDEEGRNRIILNGRLVADAIDAGDGTWTSVDGRFSYTRNSPLTVTDNETGDKIIIDDHQDGEFGIHLREDANPQRNYNKVIHGDLTPEDFNLDEPGIQVRYDELGNIITTNELDIDREDTLYDSEGNDAIYGYGGDDYINAWRGGDDYLDGGAGDDVVLGRGGDDIVIGGDGSDMLRGDSGNDRLYADQEMTLSEAFAALNAIPSGLQGDLMDGGNDNDILIGGTGNDAINGGQGDDLILGGAGDDNIHGDMETSIVMRDWSVTRLLLQENGYTTYQTIYNNIGYAEPTTGGNDVIYGGAGDDWISAGYGDDFVDGGADNDVIFGQQGDDILFGGEGDDILSGEEGADYLSGDAGDDQLYGGEGDDMLFGGEGDDTLSGGNGNDMLDGGAGNDLLFGGDGQDHILGGDGNDYIAGDRGGSDQGGDDDVIDAGAGNDTVSAQGGNDVVFAGEGNDFVDGGAGDDTLFGEAGDDQLQGGTGNDILYGGDGNDDLFGQDGDDILFGGEGDDYLLGGMGNDMLYGGEGNDVYFYTLGEGIDRISDSGGIDWLVITNGTLYDIARLDVGSLAIVFKDGSEVHLEDFDPENPHNGSIEYIEFADGVVVTQQQLVDSFGFNIEGTPEIDTLSGTALGDTINAYEGDDTVFGLGGNDTLDLGAGNDWADGGDGNDLVMAGEGNDIVYGGNGNDTLYGEGGADRLYGGNGDDYLYGGDGDDWLAGGSGDDWLEGGTGFDTYQFSAGDGRDRVNDSDNAGNIYLAGLTEEQVVFQRQEDDLIIGVRGTNDRLTVENWFASTDWLVTLRNGTILDSSAIEERLQQNQAPLAQPDSVTLNESTAAPVTVNVLANDIDPDGMSLRVSNPGTYNGLYGTLYLLEDGTATYLLNTGSEEVEGMRAGETYIDTFDYIVTDGDPAGPQSSSSTVRFTIIGENDAPVAYADVGSVEEDHVLRVVGNVLANDTDADEGDSLHVANPGHYQGEFGELLLHTDGEYIYSMDNDTAQSLGRDAVVTETFDYLVIDSFGATAASTVEITVNGVNDAPELAAPLEDLAAAQNAAFVWQVPNGSFNDVDEGDVLRYSARLTDGDALPSWLVFDSATRTFSGRVPRDAVGYLDIEVTATDSVGGLTGNGDLSTSDVFRLTFDESKGGGGNNGRGSSANAGVGNGADAPPPGHEVNFNDGDGAGRGAPGARGPNGNRPTVRDIHIEPPEVLVASLSMSASGNLAQTSEESPSEANRRSAATHNNRAQTSHYENQLRQDMNNIGKWFVSNATGKERAFLEPLQDDAQLSLDGQPKARVENQSPALVWERVDAHLKEYLGTEADEGSGFPGQGIGFMPGFGFLGRISPVGDDPLSLTPGGNHSLGSFKGLKEGLGAIS